MGYGAVLRERFPVIKFLVNAQKTIWYPIMFAILCIISGSNGYRIYLPIACVLFVFLLFSVIFADDNKVFFVPVFMMFHSIGMDYPDAIPGGSVNDSMISSFEPFALNHIVMIGILSFAVLVIRLIADGSIKAAIKKRSLGLIGVLALDIAFLTNGIFSSTYNPMTLLYGSIIAASFTVFYFIAAGMLLKSNDPIPFICKTMVSTAYIALFQFLIKAYQLYQTGNFIIQLGDVAIVNRTKLALAWGLPTIIAAVFVLGIPAALYLARKCRFSILSYISALAFLVGAALINTRSALLVGGVIFAVGAILCCFKNKKHPINAISCRIMLALILIAGAYAAIKLISNPDFTDKLMSILRFDIFNNGGDLGHDSSRVRMWETGWQDFLKNPIFGSGFDTGSNITINLFSNMYHCIIFQLFGSMGIIGVLAFGTHTFMCAKAFFTRFSIEKVLILLIPVMIVGMSLVDNFFFYPNFHIFYCAFIAIAEYMAYNAKGSDSQLQDPADSADIT